LITLIVGILATTLLSVIFIYYTKVELKKMMATKRQRDEEAAVERSRPTPPQPAPEIEPRFALTSSETGYAGSTFKPQAQATSTKETPEFEQLQAKIKSKDMTKSPSVKPQQLQKKSSKKTRELSTGHGPRGAASRVELT
jgi:hypothetical protein